MSDKTDVTDSTVGAPIADQTVWPLSTPEDRDAFVAGLTKAWKDITDGKLPSGVSKEFGKPLIWFEVEELQKVQRPAKPSDKNGRPAEPQIDNPPKPAGDKPQAGKRSNLSEVKPQVDNPPNIRVAEKAEPQIDNPPKLGKREAQEPKNVGPAKAPDLEKFYPKDGVYNPVATPGIGDQPSGDSNFFGKDMGADNTDINRRRVNEVKIVKDGTVIEYQGEIDEVLPVIGQRFSGSEKRSKDGHLEERHATYPRGADITFKTGAGPNDRVELEDVMQVDTVYNPKTRNYDTEIKTEDGKLYVAETTANGEVKSFKEAKDGVSKLGKKAQEKPEQDLSVFFPKDGVYSPVATPGIGDHPSGEHRGALDRDTGGDNTDIDRRLITGVKIDEKGTVVEYEGEIDDGLFTDTNFKGSEKWSPDGHLQERHTTYDGGTDITVKTGPGVKDVKVLEDVTQVDTVYNPKTRNYETQLKTEDGKVYRAETNDKGEVKSFKDVTDQSKVVTDKDGRPVSVTYPSGETTKIAYDDKGSPQKIDTPNGSHLVKEKGAWVEYRNGKKVGPINAEIEVQGDGAIVIVDDKNRVVTHRDGTVDVIPKKKAQATP